MSATEPVILVTGASGQLGRLVIAALLDKVAPSRIVAGVRDPGKVADFAAKGVGVLVVDYDRPETLAAAFAGVDRLLLISANEVGRRFPQHKAAIDAAKAAGVGLIAYTSILGAATSPLPLAAEHAETEAYLAASGVPHVILRNGWYIENYAGSIAPALEHGAVLGASGDGRISAATRADYAEAAAVVLTSDGQAGKVYELGGDEAFTMAEWAATLADLAGKPVVFKNLPEAEYKGFLVSVGLPEGFADLLATSDTGASKGGLYDGGKALSTLIGRPTTSLREALAAALKG